MTILERIKEQAVELKAAADRLIDDVEAAEAGLASIFGAGAAGGGHRGPGRRPRPE